MFFIMFLPIMMHLVRSAPQFNVVNLFLRVDVEKKHVLDDLFVIFICESLDRSHLNLFCPMSALEDFAGLTVIVFVPLVVITSETDHPSFPLVRVEYFDEICAEKVVVIGLAACAFLPIAVGQQQTHYSLQVCYSCFDVLLKRPRSDPYQDFISVFRTYQEHLWITNPVRSSPFFLLHTRCEAPGITQPSSVMFSGTCLTPTSMTGIVSSIVCCPSFCYSVT